MIPRFRAALGISECIAALRATSSAVSCFETAFARMFGVANRGIAFPYGRSALWAFFKAVGLDQAEVIQPAYTCSVVAHATVLSGNIPRFVDIRLPDFNMDLDQVADAINDRTRAIIATHLFGYPLDVDQLAEIVRDAEARYGHKIWVIQDCAHAFGASRGGRPVARAGDVALFGMNISKIITSIFGGMLLTEDPELGRVLRQVRSDVFRVPGITKRFRRSAYLLAATFAFTRPLYPLNLLLQDHSTLLDRLTRAYHREERICLPPDYLELMAAGEAAVGLAQLRRYVDIVGQKRVHASYYDKHLPHRPEWVLPPLVEGATYSHYVVRVPDRERVVTALRQRGIDVGRQIDYVVPNMAPYLRYRGNRSFPIADKCSLSTINLPIFAGLTEGRRKRIVEAVHSLPFPERDCMSTSCAEHACIRRATLADVPDLARIHSTSLPNDFLPSLGLRFLKRLYYPAALQSAHGVTLVADMDGQAIGFLTVAHDSAGFTRDIHRGRYPILAGYAVRRALRNPLHLCLSARVLLSALRGASDPIEAEMVFLGTDPNCPFRRRGMGRQLVQEGLKYLAERGVGLCRTRTLASNTAAINLFTRLGFRVCRQFSSLGKRYVRMEVKVPEAARSPRSRRSRTGQARGLASHE